MPRSRMLGRTSIRSRSGLSAPSGGTSVIASWFTEEVAVGARARPQRVTASTGAQLRIRRRSTVERYDPVSNTWASRALCGPQLAPSSGGHCRTEWAPSRE